MKGVRITRGRFAGMGDIHLAASPDQIIRGLARGEIRFGTPEYVRISCTKCSPGSESRIRKDQLDDARRIHRRGADGLPGCSEELQVIPD